MIPWKVSTNFLYIKIVLGTQKSYSLTNYHFALLTNKNVVVVRNKVAVAVAVSPAFKRRNQEFGLGVK